MGDLEDWEAGVVRDPHTPPQALADIAERRYDLHPAIAAHPRAYPELRQWMTTVNPASAPSALPPPFTPGQSEPSAPPGPASTSVPPYDIAQQQPVASAPPASGQYYPASSSSAQFYPISAVQPVPPPRRRNGVGCWLAGCGCLTLAGIFMVVLFVLGGLGSLTSGGGTPTGQPGSDEIAENLATYQAELETIRTLSADFEGNPVAPLILDQPQLDELAAQAADPQITVFGSRSLAQDIGWVRANLEPIVAAAQQRRGNTSGSASEALVDQAGNGYIDIAWDAETWCTDSSAESSSVGCISSTPLPVIHIMAESYFPNALAVEHVVLHELGHVYQYADAARFDGQSSDADRLIGQGLFHGSNESFADCYALTYQNLWTQTFGDRTFGYGYVCNDAERQEIRNWAASLHAPMPG